MRARKQHLKHRVAKVGTVNQVAQQGYTPVTGGTASPPSVQVMPLSQIIVRPASSQYVTVGMEDLTPIWTPDGAGIPASAPGRWGQLRAAGRP
jgi:hypothetical protein